MSLLEAQDLGRRGAEGEWLLRGVDLALGPGEAVSLAGPSGSGKTVLLRALALLDPIDAGLVLWRGEAPAATEVPAFRRRVVYLHQRPALFEGTVEDNLRRPFELAAYRDRSFDRGWAVERLRELGRDEELLAASWRDLSGGEAQLLALLRALQLAPPVLLLDEPTAALDAETAGRAEALVAGWLAAAPDERAFVWVSHDRERAARVTTRTVSLDGGRIADGGAASGAKAPRGPGGER